MFRNKEWHYTDVFSISIVFRYLEIYTTSLEPSNITVYKSKTRYRKMGTGYWLRIWSPASVDLYSFGHYTLEKRDSACKFSANTRLEFFFSCGSFLEAGRWISLASAKKSICWRKWTCCNVSQPLKSLAETSLPKPSAVRKGYLNFLSFNNALKFNLLNLLEIIKLIFCETLPRLKRYHVLSFQQEKILKTGKRFVLELFASREC